MSNTVLNMLCRAIATVGVTSYEVFEFPQSNFCEVTVFSEAAAVRIRDGLKGAFVGRSYRYGGHWGSRARFVVTVSY